MTENVSRRWLIIWSLLLLGAAMYVPAGSWTIDDAVKAISAEHGENLLGSPIRDGELRRALSDPRDFPVLVAPFAMPDQEGVKPGFSPYARLLAGIESVASRRVLLIITASIAVACGWLLAHYGLAWGFLLLPLTFYGLVPWEHDLALLMSLPAIALAFLRERGSTTTYVAAGVLLAVAIALRLEYTILVPLAAFALYLSGRKREMIVFKSAMGGALVVLIGMSGIEEFFRQTVLNHQLPAWSALGGFFSTRLQAVWDTIFAMGPDATQTSAMYVLLIMATVLLKRPDSSRVLVLAGWTSALVFALFAVRAVWQAQMPLLSLLQSGSLLFAMPWVMLLLLSREAWKTKAMTYAIAGLVLGILLVPVSSGVHWGPRLLLFTAPLLLIALYHSKLTQSRAFGMVLALTVIQTASSGALVYARYTETAQHVQRITPHAGSPLITTTRAQAIDLYPLWKQHEFFTASTSEELKQILVEFYAMRRDSAWLHLDAMDSLMVLTFPDNRPVWPHRMTIVNSGNLYRTQWRLYQLVMNRADPTWIPLLEAEAARAMQQGDNRRALFLQDDALVLDMSRAEAHSNLGLLLARMGKHDDARRAVTRALALDSTLSQARELLHQLDSVPVDASK